MRLAIVSDIHGNLLALETALAALRDRRPDAYINLGDCASGPLWPRETMELLETLRWPTVRGNHDRWLGEEPYITNWPMVRFTHAALTPAQRDTLTRLPAEIRCHGDVLAVHGRPPGDDNACLFEDLVDRQLMPVTDAEVARRLGDTDASLILCGHTHIQRSLTLGHRRVLNPGAVGTAANLYGAPLGTTGTPHARCAVATRHGVRWEIETIVLAYDFKQVADRARANGFPDWAASYGS